MAKKPNSTVLVLLGLACALLSVRTAFAQAPTERVAISINGSYQAGTSDVSSTVGFEANAERGSYSYTFPVTPGPAFDVAARIRVRKNVGVGVAFTSFSASGAADITGQVPHPFHFNQLRDISGTTPMDRKETAFHIRATINSTPGKNLQYTVFVGPVLFSIKQDLVENVSYSDSYPYDLAAFSSASVRQISQSKMGFGAGADVAYYFSKNAGIGAVATVAKANFSVKASDDSSVSLSAGGTSIGIGLRLRF